jgi:drug/metabolite transporter (DMT)-like permease
VSGRRPAPVVAPLLLATAAWGLGTVISRRAVLEIPPLTLLVVQLGASAVVLGLVLLAQGRLGAVRGVPRGLRWLGIVNPGLGYGLGLLGLASISASLAVLLWAIEPLFILVLAAVFLRERIGPRFVALSLVALVGMVLVVYEPGAGGELIGIVLTVAGVACCAAYTVASRRWLGADAAAPVVFAQQGVALVGGILAVAIVGALGGELLPADASAIGWASALASGVLYYAAAYVLYLSALRTMPAATAATSFYLIPVFGIAGSITLLGERLSPIQWLGAAISLVAVYLLLRRPQPDAVAEATAGAVAERVA